MFTSKRRSALVLAIRRRICGCRLRGTPSSLSAATRRRSRCCVALSRPTESIRLVHFQLAAALAHLGQLNEARAATQAGLALNPTFTIARFRAMPPSDNPTYLAQRERFIDGMRKAGVPEG